MIGRWVCIFLVAIVIFIWGEDISVWLETLKNSIDPSDAFSLLGSVDDHLNDLKKSSYLLYFLASVICCILVVLIIVFVLLPLVILLTGINFPFKIVCWCKDVNLILYILSVGALSYGLGLLFYFSMSLIFQKLEPILELTIGGFLYNLHKGKTGKLNQVVEGNENRKMELEKIRNEYLINKNKMIEAHNNFVRLIKENSELFRLIKENPELLGFIPTETFTYENYFKELRKRFVAEQQKKTIEVTREKIEETRKLWEEWGNLCKAVAEWKKAFMKLSIVEDMTEKELALEYKKLEAKLEMVDLKTEVKWLRLQKQKIKLKKDIEDINKKDEKSQEEKFFQNLLDKIKELKMKQAGVDIMLKERDEMLSQIDRKRNPWFYQVVKNMWNNEIYKLRKKE